MQRVQIFVSPQKRARMKEVEQAARQLAGERRHVIILHDHVPVTGDHQAAADRIVKMKPDIIVMHHSPGYNAIEILACMPKDMQRRVLVYSESLGEHYVMAASVQDMWQQRFDFPVEGAGMPWELRALLEQRLLNLP